MRPVAFICFVLALAFGAFWLGRLLDPVDEPRPLPLAMHVYFGPSSMPPLAAEGN